MPMVCLAATPGLPTAFALSALWTVGTAAVVVGVGEAWSAVTTLVGDPPSETIWELAETVAAA
jgi:hypothetical protein